MAKEAIKYYGVDPWKITETGFNPERSRVSESIFSLGNEYMGTRGFFDEIYSGDSLKGSYFNGVWEEKPITYFEHFKGLSERCCFMINANNWIYTRIFANSKELDLAKCEVSSFYRELDMKKGILTRSFVWEDIEFTFERFISMTHRAVAAQKITVKSLGFEGEIKIIAGSDFTPVHEEENRNFWHEIHNSDACIVAKTESSGQRVYSCFKANIPASRYFKEDKKSCAEYTFNLKKGEEKNFERLSINIAEKDKTIEDSAFIENSSKKANELFSLSYDEYLKKHEAFWADVWNKLDITIDGDEENQQGVRFCIFNLHQTYHGEDGSLNVGAKGLTGEKYSGWTFWDSETYCLPFYMFNNPKAAKNLIMYRYNTLQQALDRAIEQDTKGACFPMVTIDGTESCGVWQHGNLEIHVTAAIAYAVWHYVTNLKDKDFLYNYGARLLVETSRYFASRGGFSPKNGDFGLYGVMGPDEFHMMVNNNAYTNYMVKKMFLYTVQVIEEMKRVCPDKLPAVTDDELADFKFKAEKMRIPYDEETKLFEQHDGYFDLPHIDVNSISPDRVPIYKYWAYDSIFRVNMLKQPDVVLMLFFFSKDFTLEQKKVNYDFYEARCFHESSLSPSIHSIIANEIGKEDQAYEYAKYAS
ncbi:MAG: family 65 glycosyl hydrolase, partial [Clostridia bacterium]|nr:family 65 glycosyl hydrolase [Clostridia bacterium]